MNKEIKTIYKNLKIFLVFWTFLTFISVLIVDRGQTASFQMVTLLNSMALLTASFFINSHKVILEIYFRVIILLVTTILIKDLGSIIILFSGILPIIIFESWIFLKKSRILIFLLTAIYFYLIYLFEKQYGLFLMLMIIQAFLFSFFILISLYKFQRKQQNLVKMLKDANARIESVSRVNERLVISENLHDGMLQELIGVRMQLEVLYTNFDSLSTFEKKQQINTILILSKDAVTSSRKALSGISNTDDAQKTLQEHLKIIASNFQKKYGLLIRLKVTNDTINLTEIQLESILRAVSESLINVVKHSHSEIALVNQYDSKIEIIDFGKGFDKSIKRESHFGISNMKRKMIEIGGNIEIDSTLNEGTKIILKFNEDKV